MKIRWPRRLPWRTRRQLADVIRLMTAELTDRERRISELCTTAEQDTATIAFLEAELRRLAGTERGAMLSTQKPDWVLVGIPRPGVGVRVWASRELAGTSFDMTPMDQPPPRWKIAATMAQALTVDEPDYGAAMAKITEIWHNWDREAARTEARAHAVPRPAVTRGQVMLPRGGDDDGQGTSGRS
jgi:hypothetical protein